MVSSLQIEIGWMKAHAILIVVFGLGLAAVPPTAHSQNPPKYKVDPFWPKPLPNKWSMQQIVDI